MVFRTPGTLCSAATDTARESRGSAIIVLFSVPFCLSHGNERIAVFTRKYAAYERKVLVLMGTLGLIPDICAGTALRGLLAETTYAAKFWRRQEIASAQAQKLTCAVSPPAYVRVFVL